MSTNVFRIENDYLVLEISCKHGVFNALLDKKDATIAYNTKAIEIYSKFAKLNEVENV